MYSRCERSILILVPSILEYFTIEEAERAIRELDGRELRGHTVTLRLQDSVRHRESGQRIELILLQRAAAGGGARRDRYNDDYRRDYRRSRSRSPRRYDDRDRYDDREYDHRDHDYHRRSSPRRYDDRRDRDRCVICCMRT